MNDRAVEEINQSYVQANLDFFLVWDAKCVFTVFGFCSCKCSDNICEKEISTQGPLTCERLSDAGNCSEKVSKWTLSSAHFITRTDPNLMNELPYTVLYC